MKRLFPLLTAAALLAPAASALAQVPAGKTNSTAPIMSKEELRACMKREADVEQQRSALEAGKATLDAERAEVVQLAESLKPLRADADAKTEAFKQLNERMRGMSARIEAFNAKAAQPAADDAARQALLAEEKQLKADTAALQAEAGPVQAAYEAAVAALNTQARQHDSRAAAWNEKQAVLVVQTDNAQAQRQAWMRDCADRRYREDDEKAIKAGK